MGPSRASRRNPSPIGRTVRHAKTVQAGHIPGTSDGKPGQLRGTRRAHGEKSKRDWLRFGQLDEEKDNMEPKWSVVNSPDYSPAFKVGQQAVLVTQESGKLQATVAEVQSLFEPDSKEIETAEEVGRYNPFGAPDRIRR